MEANAQLHVPSTLSWEKYPSYPMVGRMGGGPSASVDAVRNGTLLVDQVMPHSTKMMGLVHKRITFKQKP